MEALIRRRFTPAILEAAAARYGVEPGTLQSIGGFESFLYAFERGDEACILRIGHSLRRDANLVHGEIDWLNHLAEGGATVARGIPSSAGHWAESLPDAEGGAFVAAAFTRASGRQLRQSDWTPAFVSRYGALLGRLHALSRAYVPGRPVWRRPDWDDPVMLDVARHLESADRPVLEQYQRLRRHLATLPRDASVYGLIHQDAHAGNFLVDDDGTITLFDFDDCAYSWFANDIAIVLFYAALWEDDPAAFTAGFMRAFLAGYQSHHRLDPEWLEQFPAFLKLREIDLYAAIHRSFDVDNLTDPWVAGFMRGRRERIVTGRPTVPFPFASLADALAP